MTVLKVYRQVVGSICDMTTPTDQPLVYVVHGVSHVADDYVILAVFTKRTDVEAFSIDNPDIYPGSLVAQQVTIDMALKMLGKDAADAIAKRVVARLMLGNPMLELLMKNPPPAGHAGGTLEKPIG